MFRLSSRLVERHFNISIPDPARHLQAFASTQGILHSVQYNRSRSKPSNFPAGYHASAWKSNVVQENQPKAGKETTGRAASQSKTSLRRVAVEAERSRGGGKREAIKKARADRDVDAKVVTAYCAAEQYSMTAVSETLRAAGHTLDPCNTGLFPQVVHFRLPHGGGESQGDVFVFPSGTVVAWGLAEDTIKRLISKTFLPAAENSHLSRMETEDLEFNEDPSSHTSSIVGDTINLGTRMQTSKESDQHASAQQYETDLALVKIAFSSGLAGSAKLAVLESGLENYFESTRSIPAMLSKGSRLPFTRGFILRKTGELLNARAQLNLNSELTDSLPDMFWDSRHELGLEGYFDRVGKILDVNVRSRVLNQKMDYAQEIVTVLREQLSEKHGLALEWLIIILIAIEVGFEILNLWKENRERKDPESTESLSRRFLERQLRDER